MTIQPTTAVPTPPATVTPAVPVRQYRTEQKKMAFLIAIVCFLIMRVFYGALWANLLYLLLPLLLVFAYSFIKSDPLATPASPLLPLLAALSILFLFITPTDLLKLFFFGLFFAVLGYYFYRSFQNSIAPAGSDLLVADLVKALVLMPLARFFSLFGALFQSIQGKRKKALLQVLLGLLIGLPFLSITFSLLSYSSDFVGLINRFFDIDSLTSWIPCLLLSLFFSVPFYACYDAASEGALKKSFDTSYFREMSVGVQRIPPISALGAILPLIGMYGIFFFSQLDYYLAPLRGSLPSGGNFSYAQYAREGFFQLCSVAFINLVVLIGLQLFLKPTGTGWVKKVLGMLLVICTIILLATAFSKLVLYIGQYDLSTQRIYAAWGMIVLLLLFLAFAWKLFHENFPIFKVMVIICLVMIFLLAAVNLDQLVAQYNIRRYLENPSRHLDIYYLQNRNNIPALLELQDALHDPAFFQTIPKKEIPFANQLILVIDGFVNEYYYNEMDIKEAYTTLDLNGLLTWHALQNHASSVS